MRVELAPDQPALVALAVDSLGKAKLSINVLQPPVAAPAAYDLHQAGSVFEYRRQGTQSSGTPAWTFEFSPKQIRLRSHFSAANPPPPLVLTFNSYLNHATLLGILNPDGSIRLPALLHLPDLGSFRITASRAGGLALGYDALRHEENPSPTKAMSAQEGDYVKVTFPAASAALQDIDYNLAVVALHPGPPELARDPRFDGFRRDWMNIFQLNPRWRALANHSASEPCAFTLFEYSSMAAPTPPLAPGLTALDLIR